MLHLIALAIAGLAAALPRPQSDDAPTAPVPLIALSAQQVNYFTPYSYYASAGYCSPNTTSTWSCGASCDANPNFVPVGTGGDGNGVQYWFVGFDSILDTVIVSHQGTKPSEIWSDITDAKIFRGPLDATLFPGLPSNIEIHSGFRDEHAKTAPDVLAAVMQTMQTYGVKKVTTVGHSLGGALTLIDSIYLPLHLPSDTVFATYAYGLPRVGNQAFADYLDATVHLTHINNKEDIVPILPVMFLGYVHPGGEVHIQNSDVWTNCPGQDNDSIECIVGDVPNILDGNKSYHDGPYNGVMMGCHV